MSTDTTRRERFERVADDVFEPLQRYLRRRASEADAADVFADALLTIWRRLDDVPDDDPLPWCYGVARRSLANHRRGNERRLRLVDRVAAEPQPSTAPDPAQAIEQRDPALTAAIETRLSDSEREIVRLWAWEALGPREIAEVLDLTPNAVSVALARAKRKLRDELDRQDPPPPGQIPDEGATERGRSTR